MRYTIGADLLGRQWSTAVLLEIRFHQMYEDVAGELERQQRRYFGRKLCSLRVVAPCKTEADWHMACCN